MRLSHLIAGLVLLVAVEARADYAALDYSTYLGGNGYDEGYAAAVGSSGCFAITGYTESDDFPTVSPYQAGWAGDEDVFLTCFDSNGVAIFSTYIGGSGSEEPYDLAFVGTDFLLAGWVSSTDFPQLNAFQGGYGGGDADIFVCRFASDGSLTLSSYLGGSGEDWGTGVEVSGSHYYITGSTASSDFPTAGSVPQPCYGGGYYDAFLTRISLAGSIDFSTYWGGTGLDISQDLALEAGAATVLVGMTWSTDFPTIAPFQPAFGEQTDQSQPGDAFVARFDSTGSPVFSTYLGGLGEDEGHSCDEEAGRIVVTGVTQAKNFPTVVPWQAGKAGSTDGFVARFTTDGALAFCSYFGGSNLDNSYGVAMDSGLTFLGGSTESLDFPTVDPWQAANAGDSDSFLAVVDSSDQIIFSTYFGGSMNDYSEYGRVVGAQDHCGFLAGFTESVDFPTAGAPFQAGYGGGDDDAFLACFRLLTPTPTVSPTPSPVPTQWLDCSDPVILDCPVSHSGTTVGEPNNSSDYSCQSGLTGGEVVHRLSYPGHGDLVLNLGALDPRLYVVLLGSCDPSDCLASAQANTELRYEGAAPQDYYVVVDGLLGFTGGYEISGSCSFYGTPTPTPSNTPVKTPLPTRTPSKTPVKTPPPTQTPAKTPTPAPTSAKTPTSAPTLIPVKTATPTTCCTPQPAVIGDYNGDGTSDIALFRPSPGLWLIRGITRVYFGSSTDEVVPRDYSGNRAWDYAIYRPSLGKWMVRGLTKAFYGVSTDIPVPGDYDGDGSADIALFRPSIGKWLVRNGPQVYYGFSTDTVVPGDYDGDGTCDIAVFRPSIGKWLIRNGAQVYYGNASDTVVPGDYTGDGSWDAAVFRPSVGRWLVKDGPSAYWGTSADTVQPGDYDGDGSWDFAVFRSSVGRWLIRSVTSAYYGASTDQPVTNP